MRWEDIALPRRGFRNIAGNSSEPPAGVCCETSPGIQPDCPCGKIFYILRVDKVSALVITILVPKQLKNTTL